MERQAALLLGLSTGTRAAQELHQRPREQPDTPARNSRTKGRVRTVCLGRLPFPAILANAQSSDAYKAACSLSSPAGAVTVVRAGSGEGRSEEHTSELQSLMRISYAVFCLKQQK